MPGTSARLARWYPTEVFTRSTFPEVWYTLLCRLAYAKGQSSPRGKRINELLGVQLRVDNMLANVIVSPERNLNYKFMVAEWLWILFGMSDLKTIAAYNSIYQNFSDD